MCSESSVESVGVQLSEFIYYDEVYMLYYVIQHVATGQLMPEMKRSRGYTHWNPNNPEVKRLFNKLETPRLFTKSVDAHRAANYWARMPNQYSHFDGFNEEHYTGVKEDGRKRTDIVIRVLHVTLGETL